MNFREYQKEAQRTMVDLGSLEMNLAHMVLGIISEDEELLQAYYNDDNVNAREEQIDKVWYVANYCTLRGFDLEEVVGDPYKLSFKLEDWQEELPVMYIFTSKLADYVKKFIAYGKPLDEKLEKMALEAIVVCLTFDDTELDFERDLQRNIDKLKARFPEKFTTEKALNRDLETERKILENGVSGKG